MIEFIVMVKGENRMHFRRYTCGILALLLCLMLIACSRQTGLDSDMGKGRIETGLEIKTEVSSEIQSEAAVSEKASEIMGAVEAVERGELSLLDQIGQTDGSYAYRDGRVYYRQYHKDSFEEGAVWACYQPIAGTDKEIVCMDEDGKKTVLFSDKGYGDLYLVGERFYMTEIVTEKQDDIERSYANVYSVDMQGQNRVDYGSHGDICAVDADRSILVLRMVLADTGEAAYYVLDCMSDKMMLLTYDSGRELTFWDYRDGWCYFDAHREEDICQVVAISVEGEQKTIMTLTPDNIGEEYGYSEGICRMRVDWDRIYIVFGGYAGSGNYFQGGRIITAKLDGSDYRTVKCGSDCYYICHEAGRTLVYFLDYPFDSGAVGETSVWDVEANTVSFSDFPPALIYAQRERSVLSCGQMNSRSLCELNATVYALPDDSARLIRVADRIDRDVEQRNDLAWNWDNNRGDVFYHHLYYADGYLYFDAEFNRYDEEYAVGWRDGYRRVQTNVYRRKLADGTLELLYSY